MQYHQLLARAAAVGIALLVTACDIQPPPQSFTPVPAPPTISTTSPPATAKPPATLLYTDRIADYTLREDQFGPRITPYIAAQVPPKPSNCQVLKPPADTASATGGTPGDSLTLQVSSGSGYYSQTQQYVTPCPTVLYSTTHASFKTIKQFIQPPEVPETDQLFAVLSIDSGSGVFEDKSTSGETRTVELFAVVAGYTVMASHETSEKSGPRMELAVAALKAQIAKIKG